VTFARDVGPARSDADCCAASDALRPDCLIHIGYHRTGSSFLQGELFPLIPDSFVTTNLDEAERSISDEKYRHIIMSSERLSSNLERDKPELAVELAQRFPGARILIGIRSQYSVMRGIYHLHIKGGGTEDYETFVHSRCGRLFNYAETVDAYQDAFGLRNVFVLLHEDLSRDALTTMIALLNFMGADPALAAKVRKIRVKPSSGDATLVIQRFRNRAIIPLRRLWPGGHKEFTYRGLPGSGLIDRRLNGWFQLPTGRVRGAICKAYAESNARLFASLGLNAANYDYPFPDRA
jgi:hypothetical protein